VLIEFERGTPIICDRSLYRELVKQAIARTVGELRVRKAERDAERAEARRGGGGERTPEQELEAEHRATIRELTARAHNTNLDLGASLLQNLAVVDPSSLDVARFFAYGLLGADRNGFYSSDDLLCRRLAANGIRLVLDEFRTTETPTLKSGKPGKTKVTYGEVDDAAAWLWKFVDGARSAGELYSRTMVVFASQHYAKQLVLAASKRRPSALPASHEDKARRAFKRVCRSALPDTHKQLERAIAREAREHANARTSWPRACTRPLRPTSQTLSASWRPRATQERPGAAAFRTLPPGTSPCILQARRLRGSRQPAMRRCSHLELTPLARLAVSRHRSSDPARSVAPFGHPGGRGPEDRSGRSSQALKEADVASSPHRRRRSDAEREQRREAHRRQLTEAVEAPLSTEG